MPADQLLYQMDNSSHQNEWYDFENFVQFPEDCLDSNSTSVNSISPKDLDLAYSELDGLDWDSAANMVPQPALPELHNSEMPFEEYIGHAVDASELTADLNDFLQFPAPSPKEELGLPVFEGQWPMDLSSNVNPYYSNLRHMVESQAAVEPHGTSNKEKRREAAIAIHLQRLHNDFIPNADFSPEINGFSSPPWSDQARGSVSHSGPSGSPASTSPSESTSQSSTPPLIADGSSRGMELVLDLNMNTPSNLPKKQKPRSRAQKENYIKVRKHGACEKHRKQHKRCNCLDKAASRLSVDPSTLAASNRLVQSYKPLSLHVDGPALGQVMRPTTPRQPIVRSNAQPPGVVDQNHVDRVVHLDQRHVHPGTYINTRGGSYQSPSMRVSSQTHSTGIGNPILEVRQPDTSQVRRIDHAAPPGRHVTDSPRQSPLISVRLPDRYRAVSTGDTPVSNVPGVRCTVSRRPDQNVNSVNERSSVGRQSTMPDHGTMRVQSIPGKVVLASKPTTETGRSLVNSVSLAINTTVGALSTYFQQPTSAISWAGQFFGRLAIFTSRQYLLARKGMGLY